MHHHNELVDEIFCQLMKQTTNNKSTKTESCLKGWRLIAILCAYFKVSESLKPYLFKYIENNAYDTKRPYNGKLKILTSFLEYHNDHFIISINQIKAIAQTSLASLRKTSKYGGRRNVPSQIELDALIVFFYLFFLTFSSCFVRAKFQNFT